MLEPRWDTLQCSVMPPELALEQFLRGLLRPVDDAFEPIRAAATLEVEALRASGSEIPSFVQTIVNELTALPALQAIPHFEPGHTARARLQSASNPGAGIYLARGFGAITLNRLVILKSETFDALFAEPTRTTDDVRCGRTSAAFRSALAVLMHELVHVRQWDVLGEDTFLTNYLIETLTKGYGADAFETEAYNFGSTVGALLGTGSACGSAQPPGSQPPGKPCFDACLDDCEDTCASGREFHPCTMACRVDCRGVCAGF